MSMSTDRKRSVAEWLLTLPSLAWLMVFFLIPSLLVFLLVFRPPDMRGGVGEGWTLATLGALMDPNYPAIIWRTIWLSLVTTAACLVLGVPVAYHMARVSQRWRNVLLLLIVIPFLTNFLIRVFAWKSLLHPEGVLTRLFTTLHLMSEDSQLLYNSGAVLLVLVYTQLPFAIMPLYAAAEKFDFSLLEAARDLGATALRAFWSVFVPGVRRGIATAVLMVFVSALGQYVIPQIVGGHSDEMIGNKIAQRAFSDRNLPHASALAACLMLAVLVPMLAMMWWQRRQGGGEEADSKARRVTA